MTNVRASAAKIIGEVLSQGSSLSEILPKEIKLIKDPRDQALLQALCFGVCRRYEYLEAIAQAILDKPIMSKDSDVFALLLIGLFQLTEMRVPEYAAVADTVSAVDDLKKAWAKGLVNAVLRTFQRHSDEIKAIVMTKPEIQFSHPSWLIGMIEKAWPINAEAILTANNQHPPMSLRVNQRKISREDYLAKLAALEFAADPIPETQHGIILREPRDVLELPGFLEGEVSVQDGAAQLAVELLQLEPGLHVLDACAAPGGKTAHIAEQEPALAELIAIDDDVIRLARVTENLERLQLNATCVAADAVDVAAEYGVPTFDRILLDAPCSASGVIRRHPDIKLLRQPGDVQNLVAEQLRLLNALWSCLKVGGLLLYVTCSVFPRENTGVIGEFMATHPDAAEEPIIANWGKAVKVGRQILPGMHNMDGFYYARLRKLG